MDNSQMQNNDPSQGVSQADAGPSPTYIMTPDGQVHPVQTEYDSKTGENLTRTGAIQNGLTPVHLMVDPSNPQHQYMIKDEELPTAMKYGLKTPDQLQLQQNAQNESNDIKGGLIPQGTVNTSAGPQTQYYHPGLASSVASQFGVGTSGGFLPNIEAGEDALGSKLRGSSDSLSDLYQNNLMANQAVSTAQQREHPIASGLAQGAGMSVLTAPIGGEATGLTKLGLQTGANAALGGEENAVQSNNQGMSDSQIGKSALMGAAGGAGGTLAGAAVGKGLGAAAKYLPELIPGNGGEYFKEGMAGYNYGNPNVRQNAYNQIGSLPKEIFNTIQGSKKEIGDQAANLTKSLGTPSGLNTVDASKMGALNDLDNQIDSHMNNIQESIKSQPFISQSAPSVDNIKDFVSNYKNDSGQSLNDLMNQKQSLLNDIRGSAQPANGPNTLDQGELYNSMQDARYKLLHMLSVDKDPDVQQAATAGLNKISGNLKSLENIPNDPTVISNVKKNLGNPAYDKNGILLNVQDVKNILKEPTNIARGILENASNQVKNVPQGYKGSELGNLNLGYKSILNAQNPQQFFEQHYLHPNDFSDIAQGENASEGAKLKLSNLNNLSSEINNNPSIDPTIKQKFSTLMERIPLLSQKNALAKGYSQGGVGGVVNKLANDIGYSGRSVFSGMSPAVQKLVQISPEFKGKLLQALGVGAGMTSPNTPPIPNPIPVSGVTPNATPSR